MNFLFLILSAYVVLCAKKKEEKDIDFGTIPRLVPDTYKTFIKEHKVALIEFYAPWCGHCKRSAPELKKVQELVANLDNVGIAVVNCVDNQQMCQSQEVQGYPTIKYFVNGAADKGLKYEGERTSESIYTFLAKLSGGALKEISSLDDVKDATKPFLVGSFDEENSFYEALKIISASPDFTGGVFYAIGNEALEKEIGKNKVLVSRQGRKDTFIDLKDVQAVDTAKFQSIVLSETMPIIPVLDRTTIRPLAARGLPFVIMFAHQSNEEEFSFAMETMESIADEFKDRVILCYNDADQNMKQYTQMGGYEDDVLPNIIYFDLEKQYTHTRRDEAEFTPENIAAWINGVMDGTIEKEIKSQEIKETQESNVYYLVAKEYEEKIMEDVSRDKFIKFYAPWCGHCKKMAPIWEELADLLEPLKDKLLIAEMDATENDVPDTKVHVRGFPTLAYYNKDGPQLFQGGDRTIPAFVKFILKNCSDELKEDLKVVFADYLEDEPKDAKKDKDEKYKEL